MFRKSIIGWLIPLLSVPSIIVGVCHAEKQRSSIIEGIAVPDVRHVNGVELHRNGHGIRSINFFGMNIKVYVAGLYSPKPLLSEDDVYGHILEEENTCETTATTTTTTTPKSSNNNANNAKSDVGRSNIMQLDFTFLRSVGKSKVISAWTQQLEHSVSHTYPGYERDRDSFINMFANAISYGGTQSVQLIGDNTVIVDQGIHKGSIPGRNFQKSFLSMWFGERAVAEDLKEGLLTGTITPPAIASSMA